MLSENVSSANSVSVFQGLVLLLMNPKFFGRLKNSKILNRLESLISHLEGSENTQLAALIRHSPILFGDKPSHMPLAKGEIHAG